MPGLLQIRLSTRHSFEVSVHNDNQGMVCGYCGDMNGDFADDMIIGPFDTCVDQGTVVSLFPTHLHGCRVASYVIKDSSCATHGIT